MWVASVSCYHTISLTILHNNNDDDDDDDVNSLSGCLVVEMRQNEYNMIYIMANTMASMAMKVL